MEKNDFSIFRTLLSDVHAKAFGEPLDRLPHGKAQSLSWMIYESTGELLSYKSLSNFVGAVLSNAAHRINPSSATLSILARFADDVPAATRGGLAWYKYRSQALRHLAAA